MPKLPRGMFRKGGGYYFKRKKAGKQTWFSLGTEYESACRKLRELRQESYLPAQSGTVAQVAKRWLASYLATTRTPKDQRLAKVRVEKYLSRFLGLKPIARVRSEDLRNYRLWLEDQGISMQTVAHLL